MIQIRHEVAVAMVVCGTLLALAPPASDYLASRQVAEVIIQRTDFQNVSIGLEPMSGKYRAGLWGLGAAMIAFGVAGSVSWRLPKA